MTEEMEAEWEAAKKVKPFVDDGTLEEDEKKRLKEEALMAQKVLDDPKFLLYKGIGLDKDMFEESQKGMVDNA